MLNAFSVLVCAQEPGSTNIKGIDTQVTQTQFDRRKLPGFRNGDADRDATRRRAEAAADEAAILRQKQTEKDFDEAITKFQKSLALFQSVSLNSKAADAALQIGEIDFILSRYDKALRAYRQAIHLGSKSPEMLCLALSRAARTFATTGLNHQADVYSSHALSQCSSIPDPRLQAEGQEARGEALYDSGKVPESADFFSRAQGLFVEAKDTNGQARALLMLAYAHFQNDRAKALQFAGEALRLWSSIGDRHGVAEVRNQLGIFAAITDEFETARCNCEKSLPVFHRMGDKDNEAIALNEIGYATRETGEVDISLNSYRRAKAIFMSIGDRLGTVEAITGLTKTMSAMRQYQQLLRLYRLKLRLAQQTRSIGQEASALENMADAYERQHQYAKASTFYRNSLEAYRATKRDYGVGDILIRLARLHVRQGEDSEAIPLLERALILKGKSEQIEDVAWINYELASIYRRQNRLADARAAIEKTVEIIESQRLKIANFDSRAAYFSSVHKYYALYIQVLMLLHQQAPEKGFARGAFEASERSKVRALLDLLNPSKEDSPCNELLQKQLVPADSAVVGTRHEVPAPVLSLKDIQAEIGSDDAVLEYVLGDEKSYVWFVDATQIVSYELPQADEIGKVVQAFRQALTARETRPGESNLDEYQKRVRRGDAAYLALARKLSSVLLGQVKLKGAKRLLIVPDGLLQYIPFSVLPIPAAGENSDILVSKHEVVMLPSASALSTLRRAAAKRMPPTHSAVIIADPVVERNDPRVTHARNSGKERRPAQPPTLREALRDVQGPQHITRLKGSRVEAEMIRQALGTQDVRVALDFAASRDYVLHGALESYRYIHFATHGIIDGRNPEMSGLVLSLVDERGKPQDGYLRLGDIYKLNLSADLVVLSACNSAMGKNLESEGIIGLPRGFLYAGSRSVIASLWKVDDEAAAYFMRGLYARIKGGASPSSALRDTQLEMSREGDWSAPFYWAAFVLQGDYK